MKKKVFYLLVLLGGLLIGDARKVQAQIAVSAEGRIPFQFYVGGKELPAGNYTIRTVSATEDSAMEIQGADGHVAAVFETERSDIGADAEVVNPDYRGRQDAAQHPTGRSHLFAFLRVL